MRYSTMIPELTVFGLRKTERFYSGILAFRLEYEHAKKRLLFASSGESRFMLGQFHEDGWNTGGLYRPLGCGANFSIEAEEAEALYRRLQQLDAAVYRGLSTRAAV